MPQPLAFKPFGVDIFCLGKKFLVFNMVSRNLKIKYRRSVLGVFWTLLNPLAMAGVYYFVFRLILNIQIPNYLIFILTGTIPWTFFVQSILEGMESVVGNWGLVSKVPVPIQIFSYVGTITNIVTLTLALPILLMVAWLSHHNLGLSLILIPYYVLALFAITYGFALILSIAFVYFRDLRHIMGIIVQVWFYATPVIYQEKMIPERYKWILFANPVAPIFTGLHRIFVDGDWPQPLNIGAAGAWAAIVLIGAILLHQAVRSEVVERI
ncbi:ABC transporter permease [Bdellovibrionota bacterium FG-2]